MKLNVERTQDRHLQHIWRGRCYLGAIENRTVVILPHWWDAKDEIAKNLPPRVASFEMARGIPAAREMPVEPKLSAPRGRPKKKTTAKR